jgi:glutamate dehydrogenase/leucine dehydrogenase
LVVDTVGFAGCGGGVRMLLDVSGSEIWELARAMTYKFCLLELPVGGAKAGIAADPKAAPSVKQRQLQAFGKLLQPVLQQGVNLACDMGTNTEEVGHIYAGAGLPARSGRLQSELRDGEPLENHVTGYGVVVAAETAVRELGLKLKGARVAIEGFGKVATGVLRYMWEAGACVVAVSNSEGTLYAQDGLDVPRILAARRECGSQALAAAQGERLPAAALFTLPVDVLVPGTRSHVIDEQLAGRVRARAIASISNLPLTAGAEIQLQRRGVMIVPDFVANMGGVLIAVADIVGANADDTFRAVARIMPAAVEPLLRDSTNHELGPSASARKRMHARTLAQRAALTTAPSWDELLALGRRKLGLG